MKRQIKFRAWDKEMKRMRTVDRIEQSGDVYVRDKNEVGVSLLKDEIELMQFTGLKDKNGKEIYEGDIVKTMHSITGKEYHQPIVFNGGAFRLASGGMFWVDWETIGNIYENPELLS